MWLQVNKETKRIQGFIEFCTCEPIPEEGCELVEVEAIPNYWMYSKYENGQFVLDEEYQNNQELEEQLREIRMQREVECFPYINRGALWYDMLTDAQKEELKAWYQAWLDAPQTKIIPAKPTWLV